MKVRSVLNGIAALCAIGMFYTFSFCMVDDVDDAEISQEYYFNTATETEATDAEINKAEMFVNVPEVSVYTKETAEYPTVQEQEQIISSFEHKFEYKDISDNDSAVYERPVRLTEQHTAETTVVPDTEDEYDSTESAGADIVTEAVAEITTETESIPDVIITESSEDLIDDSEEEIIYSENILSEANVGSNNAYAEGNENAPDLLSELDRDTNQDDIMQKLNQMQSELESQTTTEAAPEETTSFWSNSTETSYIISENTFTQPTYPSYTETDITTMSLNGAEIFTAKVEGTVQDFNAYDLVCMIVSTEMSPSFNQEALKAQAVAAYSYVKYHNVKGLVPSVLVKHEIPDEVRTAVSSVFGKCVYYNGNVAQTVYTASSAGTTASSVNVWGGDPVPYLISIATPFDVQSDPNYGIISTFSENQMRNALESYLGITLSDNPENWIVVDSRMDGNYVNMVNIDNQYLLSGRRVREGVLKFGIKSSCFDVTYENGEFTFVTYGYGHGVGMSQNGANILAKQGYTYDQILEFYFPGTTVS